MLGLYGKVFYFCFFAQTSLFRRSVCTKTSGKYCAKAAINEKGRHQLANRFEKPNLRRTCVSFQGDFDPSKVKVLHLSSNPFMQARQSKSEQMERLKQECEVLRRRVKMLEEGEKTTSTHIERIVLDESSPHDVTGIPC